MTTTNKEIPNELRITLRTSIPGFQKLEFIDQAGERAA